MKLDLVKLDLVKLDLVKFSPDLISPAIPRVFTLPFSLTSEAKDCWSSSSPSAVAEVNALFIESVIPLIFVRL